MIGVILVALAGLIQVSSVDDKIDVRLLSGTWVSGNHACGSDMELTYHDGYMSMPTSKPNEYFPVMQVISAERKGDEAWIYLRSAVADSPDSPASAIVYRIEATKFVALRQFSGEALPASPSGPQGYDWVRCDD